MSPNIIEYSMNILLQYEQFSLHNQSIQAGILNQMEGHFTINKCSWLTSPTGDDHLLVSPWGEFIQDMEIAPPRKQNSMHSHFSANCPEIHRKIVDLELQSRSFHTRKYHLCKLSQNTKENCGLRTLKQNLSPRRKMAFMLIS